MEVIHPRCAGVDISKKDAKVCVRIQGRDGRSTTSTITTWGSMTGQILGLKEHLLDEHVDLVVMEATGDYWRPFYYLLEHDGLNIILVNAHDARNVPGRKTGVPDAAWQADLGAHGLVRASFVPPPPIRELPDLTRTFSPRNGPGSGSTSNRRTALAQQPVPGIGIVAWQFIEDKP